jgi:hypothetical protein
MDGEVREQDRIEILLTGGQPQTDSLLIPFLRRSETD